MKKIIALLPLCVVLAASGQITITKGGSAQILPTQQIYTCLIKGDTILIDPEIKSIRFIRCGEKTYEIVRPAPFLQEAKAKDTIQGFRWYNLITPGDIVPNSSIIQQ